MILETLTIVAVAVVVFELVEHVVVPLAWLAFGRNRAGLCGTAGLIGQVAEVTEWRRQEGTVFVQGEWWRAVADSPLAKGDKAVVENVAGLVVQVKPLRRGKEAT